MYKVGIRYIDTKKSDSNIRDVDVNVVFYFFMCFSYSPVIPLLNVRCSVNGPDRQYAIQSNNLRKRFEQIRFYFNN